MWAVAGISAAVLLATTPPCAAGLLPPPHGLRIEHRGASGGDGPQNSELLGVDTPSPRLSWLLPEAGATKGQSAAAFHARVTRFSGAAPHVVWDSGIVTSTATVVTVAGPLAPDTRFEAVIRWSNATSAAAGWSGWSTPFRFSTGLFGDKDWAGTIWLDGSTSSADSQAPGHLGMAVSQLRTSFSLPAKPVVAARLYVASTGYNRCWINGEPVSDLQLGHHSTYEARVLYDSFDVAKLLGPASSNGHVIGCQLAAGWYGAAQGPRHTGTRGVRLLLSVSHEDGTRSLAGTTNATSWLRTAAPYTTAGIFEGIVYDQRMAIHGWNLPSYTPAAPLWQPVAEFNASSLGALTSALHPPIRKTEAFPATVISTTQQSGGGNSTWLLDFGQNAAAMLSIAIPPSATTAGKRWLADSGSADTPCSWRFAFSELLGAAGKHLGPNLNVGDVVFTATAGWLAKHTIQFEPDFSYGGFRYSLLTFACDESARDIAAADVAAAVNPAIGPGMIVSHFTHSDLAPSTGVVHFNHELLNRIQRMTRYTSFSNLMDMPTDCPTRERQGWTGDGQLTSPVVSYNFDAAAFYRKWLRDIGDAQRFFRSECGHSDNCDCMFDDCTGEVPPAAPWYQHGYHGGRWPQGNLTMPGTDPAWGMAYTVIAHHMLDWYGDLRAVREQYAGLVLYMKYLSGIPGVDPVFAPFKQTDLLTYNVPSAS